LLSVRPQLITHPPLGARSSVTAFTGTMALMNEQQRRFLTAVSNVQLLHAIGRKARLRERVVCSAATYVHRGLPDGVDVLLRLTTALWVASKVEETPVSVATLLDAVSKLGFGSRCRRRVEL